MAQKRGKPRLVAVVVTFNRRDQLRKTLDALCAVPSDILTAIVVCDNASNDDTVQDLVARTDSRIDTVFLTENRGGAGGFEAGMRAAMENHAPDWLVLMDDDGRPVSGTLEAFENQDRNGAEAWAASVTYPSGEICEMNRPWLNPFADLKTLALSLVRGRDGFHLGAAAYGSDNPSPIDGGSFVGFFVSAQAVERIGYPDAALFLYGDDVLYTLGLSQSGARIMFDPSLRFEHDCETLSQVLPVMRPLWKVYFFHRNQVLVYRKAAGPVLFWPVLAVRALQWLLRARHYGEDRSMYMKLVRMALSDGIRRRTGQSRVDIEALIAD